MCMCIQCMYYAFGILLVNIGIYECMYSCMNMADAEPDEEEDGEDGEEYYKVTALHCTALHPFMTACMYFTVLTYLL